MFGAGLLQQVEVVALPAKWSCWCSSHFKARYSSKNAPWVFLGGCNRSLEESLVCNRSRHDFRVVRSRFASCISSAPVRASTSRCGTKCRRGFCSQSTWFWSPMVGRCGWHGLPSSATMLILEPQQGPLWWSWWVKTWGRADRGLRDLFPSSHTPPELPAVQTWRKSFPPWSLPF